MAITPRKGDLIIIKETNQGKQKAQRRYVKTLIGYRPGGFFSVTDNTNKELLIRQEGEVFVAS